MPQHGIHGPRIPHAMSLGARRISAAHLEHLRAIVARVGSVHAASKLTTMSTEAIEDALTGKIFRAKSAASHEGKIDRAP
jgi:hypothetical protein